MRSEKMGTDEGREVVGGNMRLVEGRQRTLPRVEESK